MKEKAGAQALKAQDTRTYFAPTWAVPKTSPVIRTIIGHTIPNDYHPQRRCAAMRMRRAEGHGGDERWGAAATYHARQGHAQGEGPRARGHRQQEVRRGADQRSQHEERRARDAAAAPQPPRRAPGQRQLGGDAREDAGRALGGAEEGEGGGGEVGAEAEGLRHLACAGQAAGGESGGGGAAGGGTTRGARQARDGITNVVRHDGAPSHLRKGATHDERAVEERRPRATTPTARARAPRPWPLTRTTHVHAMSHAEVVPSISRSVY